MFLEIFYESAVELVEELLLLLSGLVPVRRKLGFLLHLEKFLVFFVNVNLVFYFRLLAFLYLDFLDQGLLFIVLNVFRLTRSFLVLIWLVINY